MAKKWTEKEYAEFKFLVCNEQNMCECKECKQTNQDILNCFDDITAE